MTAKGAVVGPSVCTRRGPLGAPPVASGSLMLSGIRARAGLAEAHKRGKGRAERAEPALDWAVASGLSL